MLKRERKQVETALAHALRAWRYVCSEDLEICRHSHGTTTIEYLRQPAGDPINSCSAKALQPVDKYSGSDLTGLPAAIRVLERLLMDA